MRHSRRTLTIILVCLTVLLAGCAGWGTDGPADGDDDPAPEATDDLEDADDAADEQDDEQTEAGVAGDEDEAGTDDPPDDSDDADEADTGADDETSETPTDEDVTESDTDETESSTDDGNDESEEASSDEDDDDADGTDEASDADESDTDDTADESDTDGGEASDGDEGDTETDGGESSNDGEDNGTEMYPFLTTIEVVDGDGEPVEGETVAVWPAGAPGTVGEHTTDESGEVVLEGQSSNPSDVIEMVVQVGDEERTVYFDTNDHTETFVVGADETHTLTVYAEDAVTGEPAGDAYYLLQQDNETIGEEQSGEMATFDGLEDGEYDLSVYDATADWTYQSTITIDGDDVEYTAEVDRMHVYWATVEATVVDETGDPVEGELVTFNGQDAPTDEDGVAIYDREFHYADETEVTVAYEGESETFVFDNETTATETVTFETETNDSDDEQAMLALAG